MKIETAVSAGFCFGVRRAVEKVYELAGLGRSIYTYGPIIHNEYVVNDLRSKGVNVIDSPEELEGIKDEDAVVVIRSHGAPESVHKAVNEAGLELVDATCPFVNKIHEIVKSASDAGDEILILGSREHPEVQGICGWCHGPYTVLETPEEARVYTPVTDGPVRVVSQTTFNHNKFEDIVEILESKEYNVNVMNTICNATLKRQTEAEELSKRVDMMIVIGDRHSSNSRKLFEICEKNCRSALFIETLDDLNLDVPKSVRLVGITAGASTPQNIIEEVQKAWKN